jgi:hypothetical protein
MVWAQKRGPEGPLARSGSNARLEADQDDGGHESETDNQEARGHDLIEDLFEPMDSGERHDTHL